MNSRFNSTRDATAVRGRTSRRQVLGGMAALAVGASTRSVFAQPQSDHFETAGLRGAIDAGEFNVRPGALDDQSKAFDRALAKASASGRPLFVPPGRYIVSNLTLPQRATIIGVAGATRLAYGGNGHLFALQGGESIELRGLVIDGANRWLGDYAKGLVDLAQVGQVVIDDCDLLGASKSALSLEACAGRVENSRISGAADIGLYSVEAKGMRISGNTVSDCGNGGILVHRWQKGRDGTIVSGNRIERTGAVAGGTGENGNGINVFRAGNVLVSNNVVSVAAFSAIRSNAGDDIQIIGNNCTASGETAIYSEFGFEGAIIANNVVDGACNGISVVNFNNGGRLATVSGNVVRNLKTEGPYPADPPGFGVGISVEADAAVTGNVVEGAPLFGIKLGWGPYMRDVTASGNVIRKAGTGIYVTVVDGSGPAVISGNVVDEAAHGAIVGYKWSNVATGDLARGGAEAFPQLHIAGNSAT